MGIAVAPEVICDLCGVRFACPYEWLPNEVTGRTKTTRMTPTAREEARRAGWRREPSAGRHRWRRIDVCPACQESSDES